MPTLDQPSPQATMGEWRGALPRLSSAEEGKRGDEDDEVDIDDDDATDDDDDDSYDDRAAAFSSPSTVIDGGGGNGSSGGGSGGKSRLGPQASVGPSSSLGGSVIPFIDLGAAATDSGDGDSRLDAAVTVAPGGAGQHRPSPDLLDGPPASARLKTPNSARPMSARWKGSAHLLLARWQRLHTLGAFVLPLLPWDAWARCHFLSPSPIHLLWSARARRHQPGAAHDPREHPLSAPSLGGRR